MNNYFEFNHMRLSVIIAGDLLSLAEKRYEKNLDLFDCEILFGIRKEEKGRAIHQNRITIIKQIESNIGIRKQNLLNFSHGEWILLLDTDETVSPELSKEIRGIVKSAPAKTYGYKIPYQNYVFGRPVYYGGEKYSKVRLFRKKYGSVTPAPIHEEIVVKGKVGMLKNMLHHYSYRSLRQVITKFTRYAWLLAREKQQKGERLTFSKLFFYGPHMFWARCVEDEGWRDGWRGVILAGLFGYMEGLIYWMLLWKNLFLAS